MDVASDRVRRLRAARATGHVPPDLITWLIDLASSQEVADQAAVIPPAERLGISLSEEVDRWMRRRGVTHRTISVNRRSLARVLKGANVTIDTVADVADALGCDAAVVFTAREA
jgi:hypothetical protein